MFKKLFGSKEPKEPKEPKEEKILPWIALNSIEQLNAIEEKSKTKTQLIFKHSTRCGISRMVMSQFVSAYDIDTNADLYYLDLLSYREVSNETGYKFQVMHQSPQLLVIKNGVVVAHASHGGINEMDLDRLL
ncbi:bacillithiol system redox-active protein YtxJ [uncultured Winogradskyella sp.]|uniref:bacillithiol system redox-active protein YtxJ n=1 Tax=uncultured Winogradskyella sp. TaxID=395353 RepID=UPI0026215B58|nr:bacillithiol system redox-active protein YtxJ [uncultured Winogradskyella sp.]